ncbi:MAG: CTP synthase [Chlamydiales bacterium]|nr:CTP synthase [Chlamydiales bacterium]MCH9620455.1 CTP synthase [Chlamydiales bacterium]MCH9623441.1 CTP synthase [Chlamydiales bacterium]
MTGGVVSSLGKGLTLSSIAMLLEKRGIKLAMLKLDPYLNVDPGTMNPFEHGEVYVTDDGAETDLDLGHYYRYTNSPLSKASVATSGQIYDSVIKQERRGDYLGKTVQVIPHITNEIKNRIEACGEIAEADLVLVEIGGTVGDIESLPFLEAIRQFRLEHSDNCLNIHMTYVPFLKTAGELKTKPSQHSVQVLRSIGITPDLILCRCEHSLSNEIKQKISLFCNVPRGDVFDAIDVRGSIYKVPIELHKEGVDISICQKLGLPTLSIDLTDWKSIIETASHPKATVTVGIVGKYVQHKDAYKSVFEALEHAALAKGLALKIKTIESDKPHVAEELKECDGCLVPGGFGERGWQGMLDAAQFCRESSLPYFGICLGMHVLVVEFAQNILGEKEANSTEMNANSSAPVISLIEEQRGIEEKGGTMRLGSYPCLLKEDSKTRDAYQSVSISERHRHRYEFNNYYRERLESAGLDFVGHYEEQNLCEVTEVKEHPWMIGVQFHPEFKSRPTKPHPLFSSFIQAMEKK